MAQTEIKSSDLLWHLILWKLGTDIREPAVRMTLVLGLQSCHPLLLGRVLCPRCQVVAPGSSGASPVF